MASGAAYMVRRSVEFAHTTLSSRKNGEQPVIFYLFFILTLLLFCVFISAVEYMCCGLVIPLTMIESNQPDAYVPVDIVPPNDEDDGMPKPPSSSDHLLEPEGLLMKNTPVTSSIRRTIKHLRAHYGKLSCFRGLSLFLCVSLARGFITQFLGALVFRNHLIGFCVSSILADLILARWEMTWVHIIISEPTQKRWWRRCLPLKTWVNIAPAVVLRSAASSLATICSMVVVLSFGISKRIRDPECKIGRGELYAICAELFLALILSLAFTIVFTLPASLIFVRVAASMLPEENETVVPFDRSFGGKMTHAINGGQVNIGMIEAWKSFGWSSRIRLLKNVAKIFAILLALWAVLVAFCMVEAHLTIDAKRMQEFVCDVGQQMNGN